MWKVNSWCKVSDCVKGQVTADMSLHSEPMSSILIFITGEATAIIKTKMWIHSQSSTTESWKKNVGSVDDEDWTEADGGLLQVAVWNETGRINCWPSNSQSNAQSIEAGDVGAEKERHGYQSVVNELGYLMDAFKLTLKGSCVDWYIQDIRVVFSVCHCTYNNKLTLSLMTASPTKLVWCT